MGFALTLPVCYSWTLVGRRLIVPYEAPQGRRVNGIGAYCTQGAEAGRFLYELCASLPKSTAKQPRQSPEEQAAKHDLRVEQVGTVDGDPGKEETFRATVPSSTKVSGRMRCNSSRLLTS